MLIHSVFTSFLGILFIVWCVYTSVRGRGAISFTSLRWLPTAAVYFSERKGINFFYLLTAFMLKRWRLLYSLRHIFGVGSLVLLLIIFIVRLWNLHFFDILLMLVSLFLTVLFHEIGHAISYAKNKIFVVQIIIGLPMAGKTSVFLSTKTLDSYTAACIGFSGSVMNLIVSFISCILFLGVNNLFFLYMLFTNLCFFANSLYPITKDFRDIIQHIN